MAKPGARHLLEYGKGQESRFHFNKLFFDPDRVIDSGMTMIAAYDLDGNLIGSLLNWAAHPTLLPAGNTLITADYPGGLLQIYGREHGRDSYVYKRRYRRIDPGIAGGRSMGEMDVGHYRL